MTDRIIEAWLENIIDELKVLQQQNGSHLERFEALSPPSVAEGGTAWEAWARRHLLRLGAGAVVGVVALLVWIGLNQRALLRTYDEERAREARIYHEDRGRQERAVRVLEAFGYEPAGRGEELMRHVQSGLTFRKFYKGPIDGLPGEATRLAVTEWRKHMGSRVEGPLIRDEVWQLARIDALGNEWAGRSETLMREVQRGLMVRGFYKGSINGRWDGALQRAVAQWREKTGSRVKGELRHREVWELRLIPAPDD